MGHISLEEWQSLEPLLDAALDLDRSDRAAWLDAACAGNPPLRQRVDELLRACDASERLLLTPAESFAPLFRVPEVLGDRYRIIRELGHGGMATVYLADDPKHRRQVAVKVLDVGISATMGDSRFRQEIEHAAQLQHPHILPLFDSGESDGLRYYVMPFVEGESLRDRLLREKQLPVEDAVRIAGEVADALDFAHRHGVVHRDIKPENILLHDGRSIVADFGIALAVRAAASGPRASAPDLVLGTPRYMSPEQAAGASEVSATSDLYSLGVVLYEMLAGVLPPVTSRDATSVEDAESIPLVTRRRKSVPPHVAAVIARATELLPADRFRSGREFAAALVNPAFRHGVDGGATPRRWSVRTGMLAAALPLAAVVAAVSFLRTPPARGVVRADVTPRTGQAMLPGLSGVEIDIARDGSRFVYVGESPSGGTMLWQRALDELEATPIPGSDNALAPALSPDGERVAFTAGPTIRTLPLRGGTPQTVAPKGGMPTWGDDGTLYFARDGIIHRLKPGGELAEPFTAPTDGFQVFPQALPGGRGLVVTVSHGTPDLARIAVVGPGGGAVREIVSGIMARYASPGHLLYATAGGALMAVPFDVKKLAVSGQARPILDEVKVKIGLASQFAVAETGALLYQLQASQQKELVWVSRAGGMEQFDPEWTGDFSAPSLSPDGRQLAVTMRRGRASSVWIKPLDQRPPARLALDGALNAVPAWTPDGRSLSVSSDREGRNNGWIVRTHRADGAAPATRNAHAEIAGTDPKWSPDGRWLLFRRGFIRDADIFALRIGSTPDADTTPLPLLATPAGERNAAVSPDGRWLAYTSDETGPDEVYVRPFPNTNDAKWVVSTSGGTEPLWAHSGRELFYRNGRRQMVAVQVTTNPTFSVGGTQVLFTESGLASSIFNPQYAVAPGDQRFLMIRQSRGDVAGALVLVLHVFEQVGVAARR